MTDSKPEIIDILKDVKRMLDNSIESFKQITTGNCVHSINTQLCIIFQNVIPKLKRLKNKHKDIEYVINNLKKLCNQMERVSSGNISHKINNITQITICLNEKLEKILQKIGE